MDNWIHVSEKLPKKLPKNRAEQVIVYTGKKKGGYVCAAVWCQGSFFFLEEWHLYKSPKDAKRINLDSYVSHWQPLPPPPKQVVHTPEED